MAKVAGNALISHPGFAALPEDVRNHCRLIVESVVLEGEHKKLGGVSIVGHVVSQLEAAVREAMGFRFDSLADDYEMLLKSR